MLAIALQLPNAPRLVQKKPMPGADVRLNAPRRFTFGHTPRMVGLTRAAALVVLVAVACGEQAADSPPGFGQACLPIDHPGDLLCAARDSGLAPSQRFLSPGAMCGA